MTLHSAIEKVLKEEGRSLTKQQIADKLNTNGWYKKKDGSLITAFQVHGRINKYAHLFDRKGSLISLSGSPVILGTPKKQISSLQTKEKLIRSYKDEHYVVDLCDEILGVKASRQHKFDFLRGDTNEYGKSVKLPIDAYYERFNLVVEYNEQQHTEQVKFFDKPEVITVSGVHRGEQRKIYDKRKIEMLASNNIQLLIISYLDFPHNSRKRLKRGTTDKSIVQQLLENFIK